MPFTHDQFLDVFARYNVAMWPAASLLWVVSLVAAIWLLRAPAATSRAIAAVLAVHWAWSGLAYHAAYFSAINPVAKVFAALFVLQALAFAWLGSRGRLNFSKSPTWWRRAGFAFVVYGLLYPAIGLATGQVYPRMPTFGVPCPTTLVTAGFLLVLDPPFPRGLVVIPVLWALVGGSAAALLHVPPDWALFAAALALVGQALRRRAPQARPANVGQSG